MLPDELSLTHPVGIDEQHAKLFAICAELKALTVDRLEPAAGAELGTMSGVHRAIVNNRLPPTRVDINTSAVCSDLVRYTMEHFQWEQEMLAAADVAILRGHPEVYDDFSKHYRRHLSEHASLHQHALIYRAQFEDHMVSALSLYVFVRHWLISHINRTDREFSEWCRFADGLPGAAPTS